MEEKSESGSFSSDSLGGGFDSDDDSSSGSGSNSSKSKKSAKVKKLMKLEQHNISTLLYRRIVIKIPKLIASKEHVVVTCELLVCIKLNLIMGLKLVLNDLN